LERTACPEAMARPLTFALWERFPQSFASADRLHTDGSVITGRNTVSRPHTDEGFMRQVGITSVVCWSMPPYKEKPLLESIKSYIDEVLISPLWILVDMRFQVWLPLADAKS
jgi:hypothetical protein